MEKSINRGELLDYVFETSDYGMFKRLESNRAVTDGRVKKLIASISEHEVLNPIIVNEKYEIIDGQGRFEALKRLGRSIKYIICNNATIEDCRRMNRYNTKWGVMDWVYSWSMCEDESIASNYRNIMNASKKTGLSVTMLCLLTNKSRDGKVFEKGTLKFTDKDFRNALEIHSHGKDILKALCFEAETNRAFWKAVRTCFRTDGYEARRMIENCEKQRSTYIQMSRFEDMLKEFSRIYNYRAKKDMLFFEDAIRTSKHSIDGLKASRKEYTAEKYYDVATAIC